MHFLEDQVSQWITKWGFGMALHGEPVGESNHREFNRIDHNIVHVKKDKNKILYMMKEHHILVHPVAENRIIRPK